LKLLAQTEHILAKSFWNASKISLHKKIHYRVQDYQQPQEIILGNTPKNHPENDFFSNNNPPTQP